MVRCGELCKGCKDRCNKIHEGGAIAIQCPQCGSDGCDDCEDGMFHVRECPKEYVGDLAAAINLVSLAEHALPVAGGLLDQSAWFVSLWQTLDSEMAKISNERMDRISRG